MPEGTEGSTPEIEAPVGLDGESIEAPDLPDVGEVGEAPSEEPEEEEAEASPPAPPPQGTETVEQLRARLEHESGKASRMWTQVKELRGLTDRLIPFYQDYMRRQQAEGAPEAPRFEEKPVEYLRHQIDELSREFKDSREEATVAAQRQAEERVDSAIVSELAPLFDEEQGDPDTFSAYQHLARLTWEGLQEEFPTADDAQLARALQLMNVRTLRRMHASGRPIAEQLRARASRVGWQPSGAVGEGALPRNGNPSPAAAIAARSKRDAARRAVTGPASTRAAAAPGRESLREVARELSEDEYIRRRIKGKIKDEDLPEILPGELEGSWYAEGG